MAVRFQVNRRTLRETRRNLLRTGRATAKRAEAETKQAVSRRQPVARRGGRLVGLAPSRPGEPPKMVTGDLRSSIRGTARQIRRSIVVRLEAGVPYAEYLEPPGWLNRPFLRNGFLRVLRRSRTFSRNTLRRIS